MNLLRNFILAFLTTFLVFIYDARESIAGYAHPPAGRGRPRDPGGRGLISTLVVFNWGLEYNLKFVYNVHTYNWVAQPPAIFRTSCSEVLCVDLNLILVMHLIGAMHGRKTCHGRVRQLPKYDKRLTCTQYDYLHDQIVYKADLLLFLDQIPKYPWPTGLQYKLMTCEVLTEDDPSSGHINPLRRGTTDDERRPLSL